MPKKKADVYEELVEESFTLPSQLVAKTQRKGIREGTRGLAGARIIQISRIKPDPNQPRKNLPKNSLRDLAVSIKEHGLLQPITVEYKEEGDYFQIVNGERRYRACLLANLSEIPCIIKNQDLTPQTRLEQQLVENLQREDLNPIEEAEGYKILKEKYGYTDQQLASKIGKARSVITETNSLNRLPRVIKDECRARDIAPRKILMQVARESSEPKMVDLWQKIKHQNFTLRQIIGERKKSKLSVGKPPRTPAQILLDTANKFYKRVSAIEVQNITEKEKESLETTLRIIQTALNNLLKALK